MPKNKNIIIFTVAAVVLIAGGFFLSSATDQKNIAKSRCQTQEIIFYYLDTCGWCQKVKNEGTISKIEQLGVKVKQINAAVGPIRHKFEGVPTFVINDEVYSGYKTFEELKELLKCPLEEARTDKTVQNIQIPSFYDTLNEINFTGEKGEKVELKNGEISLAASIFNNNQARFYNIKMSNDKTIYFFVVKDKNGIYRAAANACAVCFKTYKGFRQEGNEIVCNNCGNRYPVEKIATEKGGCNPGPINPNLEVRNSQIIIKQADIEQVAELF